MLLFCLPETIQSLLFYRKDDFVLLSFSDSWQKLWKEGYKYIAGVDEVGRGPLIGPVVTAAVILPPDFKLEGLTDSKKLTEKKREELFGSFIYLTVDGPLLKAEIIAIYK